MPWTKIWKEPCIVVMEDIHLVCAISNNYDQKNLKKFHLNQKFSKLKKLENQEVNFNFVNYTKQKDEDFI